MDEDDRRSVPGGRDGGADAGEAAADHDNLGGDLLCRRNLGMLYALHMALSLGWRCPTPGSRVSCERFAVPGQCVNRAVVATIRTLSVKMGKRDRGRGSLARARARVSCFAA